MSNHEHTDPQDAGEEAVVRRAWRQASDELPPPELDAAIVAAARESVQDRDRAAKDVRDGPRSRSWLMQWQPLAAAATVAGLAFILLQLMPRDREVIPSIRMEESAPAPVTARPGTTEPPATDQGPVEPSPNSWANEATPAPARTEQKIAVPKAASAEADRQAAVVQRSTESGASVAAAPASEARQRDAATTSSADWAARVVSLYESGDLAGAASELRAFRAAEPDADSYLPEALRDWARTVK